uniref:Uncharacterized protein n=1 Tax=Anguilla anguilla TaxID=7936 RepID=A0A0E9PRS4_ANGAN
MKYRRPVRPCAWPQCCSPGRPGSPGNSHRCSHARPLGPAG